MRHPSQISDRFSAEWLAGYRAALAELDRALGALGGPAAETISPLVRARVRARLIELEAGRQAA
ncbi:MAG TPA: hypothetical protein VFY90_14250 [Tepidiformaceae bacterium]|nr:hypothetical protein [Tepidiformaceae bacterium]